MIEDGVSGIIVDDWQEMPAALERADALDPLELRRHASERFSPERMVERLPGRLRGRDRGLKRGGVCARRAR